ncbi:MAG: hypothetical protein FJZ01_01505 [Candidatus Sericytochromatia bacterium]|nr:hypothetical protein [Candidatus Tanganyikabacteria bacterium]
MNSWEDLDPFERARARAWSEGLAYLPLRAYCTQMNALIDLVYAWTALEAPRLAPQGKVVPIVLYRYRAQFEGKTIG